MTAIKFIMMKRQQVGFQCGNARRLRARAGELKVGYGIRCARLSGACGNSMHLCMHVSTVDARTPRNILSALIFSSKCTRMCSHGELCHLSLVSVTFTSVTRVWVPYWALLHAHTTRTHACASFTLSLLTMRVQAFACLRQRCEYFSMYAESIKMILGSSEQEFDRSPFRAAFCCST